MIILLGSIFGFLLGGVIGFIYGAACYEEKQGDEERPAIGTLRIGTSAARASAPLSGNVGAIGGKPVAPTKGEQ